MKKNKPLWNHNYAYHGWIAGIVGTRKHILDVGCGNGMLAMFLRKEDNEILGIDPSGPSVQSARERNTYRNVSFQQTAFEDFDASDRKFDAVIFVASLHHMNMRDAVCRAKALLAKNGVLIVVGLAKPSTLLDWVVEAARIIPSKMITAMKHNTSSEELHVDVSYDFPTMNQVRQLCREQLDGYSLRYGLHYRYLLTWENK